MTREVAIKGLKAFRREFSGYEPNEEMFDMAIKALEQEPRWIPVSERMPEEREWIGTKRFGTTISDEVYVTLETSDGERFTKHLSFQNGELSQIDQETMRMWFKEAVPIAWMPKPKPYKPQESEDKMVAIKDFEMPVNCGDCYLTSIKSVSNPWDMICSCNLKDIDINERTRAEHCPLVEIKEVEDGNYD